MLSKLMYRETLYSNILMIDPEWGIPVVYANNSATHALAIAMYSVQLCMKWPLV